MKGMKNFSTYHQNDFNTLSKEKEKEKEKEQKQSNITLASPCHGYKLESLKFFTMHYLTFYSKISSFSHS